MEIIRMKYLQHHLVYQHRPDTKDPMAAILHPFSENILKKDLWAFCNWESAIDMSKQHPNIFPYRWSNLHNLSCPTYIGSIGPTNQQL
jgi:hypothetical protein